MGWIKQTWNDLRGVTALEVKVKELQREVSWHESKRWEREREVTKAEDKVTKWKKLTSSKIYELILERMAADLSTYIHKEFADKILTDLVDMQLTTTLEPNPARMEDVLRQEVVLPRMVVFSTAPLTARMLDYG